MNRHHLLLSPNPEVTNPGKRGGGSSNINHPSISEQVKRLSTPFSKLEQAFNKKQFEILNSAQGVEPEYTLVLEIIGTVPEFYHAARKISGFEWLGEYDLRGIEPDEFFHSSSDKSKPLSGQVMMILSDKNAIYQLLSLWKKYAISDGKFEFPLGLAKCKNLFNQLKDIRVWDVQDRLEHTGVLEDWSSRIKEASENRVRFEVELWYRKENQKRIDIERKLKHLVHQLDGEVISSCCKEEIRYHSLLLELPLKQIEVILNDRDVELVKCDNIMLFRPLGQMIVEPLWDNSTENDNQLTSNFEDDYEKFVPLEISPRVALFDGLPITNHNHLNGKLFVDDPDNFELNYPAEDRKHGTAMASLICNGDLEVGSSPLSFPIYVRPIFKPNTARQEAIPDEVLPIDLIHRAVKRLFEYDGNEEPVAPDVKIINLSVGDPNLHFNGSISPLARLLDWLSHKYNVLFVVSAGNHSGKIEIPNMTAREFRQLSDFEKASETLKTIQAETWNRKILSPAESINALTVGSISTDSSTISGAILSSKYDIYSGQDMPAFYSAHGNGYARSMKPDIVVEGGRMLLDEPFASDAILRPMNYFSVPGHKVACPSGNGSLNETLYSRGTSNSTALTTRACAQIWEILKKLFTNQNKPQQLEQFGPQIVKALSVHGANWGTIYDRISNYLGNPDKMKLKMMVSQMIGYGKPDFSKAMHCLDNRATIIGFGMLAHDQAHLFKLPIPGGLGGGNAWRKLTISLAWFAKPHAEQIKYRDSALWFEIDGDNKNLITRPKNLNYDWQMVRKGTLQHEIFEGKNLFVLAQDDRNIHIRVNCKSDAADIFEPIKYGIAITLEVADGTSINLYQEIKQQIDQRVKQASQTRIKVS